MINIYITITKVNIYAQTMGRLHGGATTFAQPHYNKNGYTSKYCIYTNMKISHVRTKTMRLTHGRLLW